LLLLVVSLAAAAAGVFGWQWRTAREIEAVFDAWQALGAEVVVSEAGDASRPAASWDVRDVSVAGPLNDVQRRQISLLLARSAQLPSGLIAGLHLRQTPITTRDAASIGALSGLRSLTLFDAGLTDEHLAKLAAAESLESLYVGQNEIGDDGVAALHALKKLRYLSIEANPVTEFALEDLRAAIDLLEISDD
jgi:hypothetical protein